MSYDTARPYLAAFVIVRKDGKVAFVKRSHTGWMDGYYGLPSGKAEEEEAASACAVREAKEEIGVDIDPNALKPVLVIHRLNKGDHAPEWIDIFFEVERWEGTATNVETDKHSELAWLDLNNLPNDVIPPVKAGLEALLEGKSYLEYSW